MTNGREQRPETATRRRYVRAIGTAGAAVLAGCTSRPNSSESVQNSPGSTSTEGEACATPTTHGSATPDRLPPLASEYETAVNVVAAGADPTGETPVNSLLSDELGDDTLLYFPRGRYKFDGIWDVSGVTRLALVGDGATVVPRDGYRGNLVYTGRDSQMSSLRVVGLSFDFTSRGTGPRPLNVRVGDELLVSDVRIDGSTQVLRCDVTNPDGRGVVRRLRVPDGAAVENATGWLVDEQNRGELTFENCHVEGFPDNGLYASSSRGPVRVIGGTYANNGKAGVRVSGPATVRGATIRCDSAPDGFPNMRGIWLRGGRCLVENCDVQVRDVTFSGGAIVTESSGTIRNSRIRVDPDDVRAIMVNDFAESSQETDQTGLQCADVEIVGSASFDTTVEVSERDGCTFERLRINQPGESRDGFRGEGTDGSVIRDTSIAVTGDPIDFVDSDVTTENVTTPPPEG